MCVEGGGGGGEGPCSLAYIVLDMSLLICAHLFTHLNVSV